MSELGLVSSLLLAGIVLGMGSVFLSMWFLPALLKRLDAVTVISQVGGPVPEVEASQTAQDLTSVNGQTAEQQAANKSIAGQQPSKLSNGQEFTGSRIGTAGNGAAKQDIINEELMAAIAATLCAYGIAHNESYRIKQVRVVN